jgi:hypothetical protein
VAATRWNNLFIAVATILLALVPNVPLARRRRLPSDRLPSDRLPT